MIKKPWVVFFTAVFSAAALLVVPRLAPANSYQVFKNIVYARRDSGALRADIYRPMGEGLRAVVVVIHGGAWLGGAKGQLGTLARTLASQGYVAMAINYRLAPVYPFPAQIDDCHEAVQWIRDHGHRYNMDSDRVGAWGYSSGGHLAALLGMTNPHLHAVVAGGAPCDFRPLGLDNPMLVFWLGATRGENPQVYREASPAHFVSPEAPPTFFYHGGRDRIVPLSEPATMVKKLNRLGVPAEVYVAGNQGHARTILHRESVEKAMAFLDEHLQPRPASITLDQTQ